MEKVEKIENNSFDILAKIDVSGFIEEKNGLKYLSWSNAWKEVKRKYPNATYRILRFGENNLPYVADPEIGYMVFTEVTIDDLTHEMWLPAMNSANHTLKKDPYILKTRYKEFKVDGVTMFDINKTIMRCLTKNLAMFGLGLNIYTGEDLPETVEEQPVSYPAKDNTRNQEPETEPEEDLKKKVQKLLIEKFGKENYSLKLQELSTFEIDGKKIEGITTLANVSDKRLKVIYGKLKTIE